MTSYGEAVSSRNLTFFTRHSTAQDGSEVLRYAIRSQLGEQYPQEQQSRSSSSFMIPSHTKLLILAPSCCAYALKLAEHVILLVPQRGKKGGSSRRGTRNARGNASVAASTELVVLLLGRRKKYPNARYRPLWLAGTRTRNIGQ